MGYDIEKRAIVPIRIVQGPVPHSSDAPKATAVIASGQTGILSGMVVTRSWNASEGRHEWYKGNGGSSKVPYLVHTDAGESSLIESGKCMGLGPIGGRWLVGTSCYKEGATYTEGTPLTFDGTTGNVKPTTGGVLNTNEDIIGFVEGVNGLIDESEIYPQATDANRLYFRLCWMPYRADPA